MLNWVYIFFNWLYGIPTWMVFGSLFAGFGIGIYKITAYFLGRKDIYQCINDYLRNKQQLKVKEEKFKVRQRQLQDQYDANVKLRDNLQNKIKELNAEKDNITYLKQDLNDVISDWVSMSSDHLISEIDQQAAVNIMASRINGGARREDFYKSLKSIANGQYGHVVTDDVYKIRTLLEDTFKGQKCSHFSLRLFDTLMYHQLNPYLISWMLYTFLYQKQMRNRSKKFEDGT